MQESLPISLSVAQANAGTRLDSFLTVHLDVSRARVQQLIERGEVLVNGAPAKAALRLKGDERITITGPPQAPPLRAIAEEIPLDIVYEDDDLAVINKPAGMMVHAGAGATDDARNRGTLVNALLHHFNTLSGVGGDLRPGIVHRLDRETSGLMVVAKTDEAHRRLARQFSSREVHKTYLALVHGWPKKDRGTIHSAISRDAQRRTRMTTRQAATPTGQDRAVWGPRPGGRDAVTHYAVARRLDSPYGKFALLEVKIETGRTHQIRVHMASLGHPVVGDSLYGAPAELRAQSNKRRRAGMPASIALERNFLHSSALELKHPRTGESLSFQRPLPERLANLLETLESAGMDVRA
jgi:23S rRNA pseudouridine1911/1915/1917 synthase